MFQRFFALVAAVGLHCCAFAQAQEPQSNLPTHADHRRHVQIDAQLAQTPEQREIGLMFRKEMPQHEGMLFVFEQPASSASG